VQEADHYEAGATAHGFQSEARAVRAAARHDQQGARAVDAWSKAEYWQRRTAGVIANAPYKSGPGVRMGRIKALEADFRRVEAHGRAPEWANHYALRIIYEKQMLEAQGGRAAHVEMVPGGFISGKQIHKVNKSSVTGRVVSVLLRVPRVSGWAYQIENVPGADYALMKLDTERLPADAYTAPTAEDLAALAAILATTKASKPKAAPCPLVNPTDDDAERLQAVWNAQHANREPVQPVRMTQEQYNAASGGAHSSLETVEITGGGIQRDGWRAMSRPQFPTVAKVRSYGRRVVILSDKPQKAFAPEVWVDPRPAVVALVRREFALLLQACRGSWLDRMSEPERAVFDSARSVGLAYAGSLTQFGLSREGHAMRAESEACPVRETVNA
jgi:hypothetical protein